MPPDILLDQALIFTKREIIQKRRLGINSIYHEQA